MSNIQSNLEKAGIILPQIATPAANYLPATICNDLLYISGQLPVVGLNDKRGQLGTNISEEEGVLAARSCGINIIAVINHYINNDWSKFDQIIRLEVFVSSATDFYNQPLIANGASDLMVEIFGDSGKHSRFAIGTAVLPKNTPVEIGALVKLK